MKKINKGIVFSNDIKRILNGINAYNYSYGLIPSNYIIEEIRNSFKNETRKIFKNEVTIIDEEEMLEIIKLTKRGYPHCIIR